MNSFSEQERGQTEGMGRKMGRRTKGLTMHSIVFVRVQRVQNVEETLNEFKRTRLVSRKVGGRMEWEGRRLGGQVDCDCAPRCICEGLEGSDS